MASSISSVLRTNIPAGNVFSGEPYFAEEKKKKKKMSKDLKQVGSKWRLAVSSTDNLTREYTSANLFNFVVEYTFSGSVSEVRGNFLWLACGLKKKCTGFPGKNDN